MARLRASVVVCWRCGVEVLARVLMRWRDEAVTLGRTGVEAARLRGCGGVEACGAC